MAINPFRVGELQLPQPVRPVPIDFSPLQSIGEGIGQYRQQQEIGSILAGATGPDGQLDLDKAATGLGAAGHVVLANRLVESALRQKALTSAEADRAEQRRLTERGQDLTAGQAADMLKQRQREFDQGKVQTHIITNPDTDEQSVLETGGPNGPRVYDLKTRTWSPAPAGLTAPSATPAAAPATVGPRSEAPAPGASFNDRFAALGADAAAPPVAAPTRVAALGDVALPSGPAPAPAVAPTQVAQAAPAEPVQPQPGEAPPLKPDTKARRTEFSKKLVDQEADLVKGAGVARELLPEYDAAINALRELQKSNRFGYNVGTGPLVASGPARAIAGRLGLSEENARQRFDKAMAAVKARISSIDLKGQGSVSNFERGLAAAKFPDLTGANAADQMNILLQQRELAAQNLAAGRDTPLGRASRALREEAPAIGAKSDSAFDEKALAQYKTTPAAAMARARDLLKMGADPARVKAILDEVDTSLAKRMGL